MGIKNFYTEKGDGFPLILLYGNGEDSSYFEHQIYEFSKYYKVYAIDTRGHGKTPRGDKPFTLNQFAEDLHNFLNEKNIEKDTWSAFQMEEILLKYLFLFESPKQHRRENKMIFSDFLSDFFILPRLTPDFCASSCCEIFNFLRCCLIFSTKFLTISFGVF